MQIKNNATQPKNCQSNLVFASKLAYRAEDETQSIS